MPRGLTSKQTQKPKLKRGTSAVALKKRKSSSAVAKGSTQNVGLITPSRGRMKQASVRAGRVTKAALPKTAQSRSRKAKR